MPALLCTDINQDPSSSAPLQQACAAGLLVDVGAHFASGFGVQVPTTFRHHKGESRIDAVFATKAAFTLVDSIEVLPEHAFCGTSQCGHFPIHVHLNLSPFRETIRTLSSSAPPFQAAEACIGAEEAETMARPIVAACLGRVVAAVRDERVDALHQILCDVIESFVTQYRKQARLPEVAFRTSFAPKFNSSPLRVAEGSSDLHFGTVRVRALINFVGRCREAVLLA